MYKERLRANLRKVIAEHGFETGFRTMSLKSISYRHVCRIEAGTSYPRIDTLENIADEIGADMLEFFRE